VKHEGHPLRRRQCVHDDVLRTSATKAGIIPEKLLTVAAWYEDPRFDDAERAALALTEAATRLADRPGAVTDEIWAEAVLQPSQHHLPGAGRDEVGRRRT
jgi:alkylhydroperoxidase family enzyme